MNLAIALLSILLFSVCDAMSDANMFKDFGDNDRMTNFRKAKMMIDLKIKNYSERWHRWQFIRQGTMIAISAYVAQSWALLLLNAAVFWIVHDGLVNIYGLDRKFFFVGTTAWFDRQYQKTKHPQFYMALSKFLSLGAGIALLLWTMK